jgi:hypothetical protein
MSPIARLLVARYRLACARRPELAREAPWYAQEGERLRAIARAHGLPERRVIDAAAVLSPAMRWEDLMARLPAFCAARSAGLPCPRFPGYGRNVRRAWDILGGVGAPSGPKVSRFARNLAGDETPVTVDRWAARAAGLPESGGRAWYRELEEAYRAAAETVGLPPSRFQAVVWLAVRDRVIPWGLKPRTRG